MVNAQLIDIIRFSITEATKELTIAEKELEKIEKGDWVRGAGDHRNRFRDIVGPGETDDYLGYFYYDLQNPALHELRIKSKFIWEERDREYDKICRKYLDFGKVKAYLSSTRDKDPGNMVHWENLVRLLSAKLIGGAELIGYDQFLIKSGLSDGFETYAKVSEEYFLSPFRKKSVQQEVEIFNEYIHICKSLLTL